MANARAEYLREKLIKQGIAADKLTVRHLTYQEVTREMSSEEYEWHQRENLANLQMALDQPRGQAEAQQSKDANAFRRFSTGSDWSGEDQKLLVANLRHIHNQYPAFVPNQENGEAVANWLINRRVYPSYENLVLAFTTLAAEGKLLLNPSAVGIPEDRYGDSVVGYEIHKVNATDLRRLTTPYRARTEASMSAEEYWAAHPELAAERFKRKRAAARAQEFAKAEAEVQRFLATQLNYQPTEANRKMVLSYLESHNLPLTAEALFEAFRALKSNLAQSDKGLDYGSTRVVVFDERNENPSYISEDLRKDIRRKIARFSASQYAEWLRTHPEEAAIINEQ